MNLREAITFPFKDPNWLRKLVVASVVFLFGMPLMTLGMPFLLGWIIQLGRKVWYGREVPMPKWKDAPAFFVEGLKRR